MLKNDINAIIGDFGVYQLRIFVVVFFMGMLSLDSIQIVFIAANMAHWCRVPQLDQLPYDVQKNVAIPAVYSGRKCAGKKTINDTVNFFLKLQSAFR